MTSAKVWCKLRSMEQMQKELSKWEKHCLLAVIIAVLVTYFAVIYSFAQNIPYWDDFDMLLNPVLQLASGRDGRFDTSLLKRHGEHIVALPRLLSVSLYYFTGEINFRWLIFLGNLSLILVAFGLFRFAKLPSLEYIAPIIFFLFQIQFFQSSLWASGSLQHFLVYPLVLSAFSVLESKGGIRVAISIASALLACLTQGNAIVVLPLIAVLLLPQKRYFAAISCALAGTLVFFLFVQPILVQKSAPLVNVSLSEGVLYLLSFLGCITKGYWSSIALGLVFLLLFFVISILGKAKSHPTIYAFIALLLVTAMLNTLARVELGSHYPVRESRYTLPSVLILISYVVLLMHSAVQRGRGPIALRLCACLALAFSIWSYVSNAGWLFDRYERAEESVLHWKIGQSGLAYVEDGAVGDRLRRAEALAVYRIPEISPEDYLSIPADLPAERIETNIDLHFEPLMVGNGYFLVEGFAYLKDLKESVDAIYLQLEKDEVKLVLTTTRRTRMALTRRMKHRDLRKSGFLVIGDSRALLPGHYAISVILQIGDKYYQKDSTQRLSVG